MMIWIAIPALLVAALIIVLPPLLRGRTVAARHTDLAVYRDQLKEVDTDEAQGLITAIEAEAARTEIKRRILVLPAAAPATQSAASRPLAIATAVAVSALSLATYFALGRPSLPSRFYDAKAEADAADQSLIAQVDAVIAKLKARLDAQPNDATGWRLLGSTYLKLGRVSDGIDALARALTLDPADSSLWSQYGEALVQAADGHVTADAIAAFDEALKRDPKEPRARFYKGLALVQQGKDADALDAWIAIIRDSPADAEWLPAIRSQARDLAAKLKRDPSVVP
jgi:cytochrome c-type biogenesis protein CcmH